jgi:hypothetical protein
MFYRSTNSKHLNTRIVTLAAGLALATAAVVGSDLLEEKSNSSSTSQVTPRIERISPQFGTMADAVYGSQGIRAPSQFATAGDAVYALDGIRPQAGSVVDAGDYLGLGQPAEQVSFQPQFGSMADADYMTALETTLIDPTELGSLGIEPTLLPQFGTMADADYASR